MLTNSNISGKNIFITGAPGFLGRHLLPRLLEAGANVRCLVRSATAKLPDSVKIIHGDCLDAEAIERCCQDQDIVIHMAGMLFGANWRDYFETNVKAARNMALAAHKSLSIKRVIFISSLAAAGPCGIEPGRNEREAPEPVSAYGWSKLMAENIFSSILGNGEELVILRPPIIYGSGDKGLLPLFKSCGRGYGISPGLFPVSIIHADDCARAIIAACWPKASGIYHLNDGRAHAMDNVCKQMGAAQGRHDVKVLHFPKIVMGATAFLSEAAWAAAAGACRALRLKEPKAPAWNMDKFRESAQKGWLADASRIERELGFEALTDIEMGMAEAVAGYRKEGWL